jgi:hypothetical protein
LWQRTRMKRAGKSLAAQVVSPCIKNLSQGGAKMSFSTMRNLMLLSLVMVGVMSTPVLAEEYPERPIEVIVAFGPGGGTDVAARTIEPFIEKYLDEDLVIMNKPGAGGEVGFSLLAASNPDGYTMGFINLPAMFAYSYARETQYSRESFAPIANLVYDPGISRSERARRSPPLKSLSNTVKTIPALCPSAPVDRSVPASIWQFSRWKAKPAPNSIMSPSAAPPH